MKNDLPTTCDTRTRVLDAAGQAFAEHGFRQTTVRDICEKAGANIAAVNYHFRDKESLYAEVLKHSHRRAREKYPMAVGDAAGTTIEARLKSFVQTMLFRILDEGKPAWHGKLMAREMAEPTPALDSLVEETIRPTYAVIAAIVRDAVGEGAALDDIRRAALSVVGQIVFHHQARAMIQRVTPEQKYTGDELDKLANHITRFSLAGLRSMNECAKGGHP